MQRTPPPARHPDAPLALIGDHDGGMVASTHHLASRTGAAVLRAGGNAVDAAVAANAVVGVVRPDTCGPGGDLFALVHHPGDPRPAALNSSGYAGSNASAADLRSRGLTEVPLRGPESITIPGCVDGWVALLENVGTLDLESVLRPAIELAADGFEVSPELAASIERLQPLLFGQPAAAWMYPDGRPAAAGSVVTRPDLATSLERLARDGRDAFYLDVLGEDLVRLSEGCIDIDDLARFQSVWVRAIGVDIVDVVGWTVPPNSQGFLTLAALWIAERLTATADPEDPAFHHTLIEAYRVAAHDRDDIVTDPATAPLRPEDLLAEARLGHLATLVDVDRAVARPPLARPPGGTTHLVVRDGSGAGISLIQSNFHGIGAARSIDGTGIFLHNRWAGFTLRPEHPNELAPGRRPLHTLSPTLWTTPAGRLEMLLGTRGGQYQPQLLLQVAARMRLAGQTLVEAVAAPRWVVDDWAAPGHTVRIEPFGARYGDRLRSRGHQVVEVDDWQRGWGPVAAIQVDEEGVIATGDPRVSTSGAATT